MRLRNLVAHLRRVGTDERLRSAAVTYGRLDHPRLAVHIQLTTRDEFHRLRSCVKEPWTVRWIEGHLRPGETLYDVGANIGAYSLIAAMAVPGSHVVSFEPSPANFAALCANAELNEVTSSITPVPFALGDHPRAARLEADGWGAGRSPRVEERPGSGGGPAVLVERLDDLVERFGLPPPDHLKLDVEGGELDVLAGGSRVLGEGRVKSAMVELDREHEREVSARLAEFGLELAERSVGGSDRPPGAPAYGLFVRR